MPISGVHYAVKRYGGAAAFRSQCLFLEAVPAAEDAAGELPPTSTWPTRGALRSHPRDVRRRPAAGRWARIGGEASVGRPLRVTAFLSVSFDVECSR